MTATSRIERFVAGLQRRHKLWSLALVAGSQGLLAAVVVVLVDMVAPGHTLPAAVGAVLWVVLALGVAALRLRMPVAVADRQLGLRDHLLTYLGLRRRRVSSPLFAAWLERDLERRIADLPEARVRSLWRRPLGPLRYLVPLLVLMILLRAFAPLPPVLPQDGSPLAQGPQGGGPGSGGGGSSDSGDAEAAPPPPADESGADPEPDRPPPQPENDDPAPDPPPSPPPPQGQDHPAPEPRPLIDLPTVDEFAVPEFIGEGPARRDLVRVAQLPDGDAGAPRAPSPAAGAPPSPPNASPEPAFDPAAAAERAVRSRHVPPEERPFVRRYFEVLRKAVR